MVMTLPFVASKKSGLRCFSKARDDLNSFIMAELIESCCR